MLILEPIGSHPGTLIEHVRFFFECGGYLIAETRLSVLYLTLGLEWRSERAPTAPEALGAEERGQRVSPGCRKSAIALLPEAKS